MTHEVPKISETEFKMQSQYANILDEVRIRIEGLNIIVPGTTALPTWLTAELIYLQLRMLCELVAVGCLVAHGDLEKKSLGQLPKRYEAGAILQRLEALHPQFFPKPITVTSLNGVHHIEYIENGFLSKAQFLELYAETHRHLHRGSMAHIFRKINPKQPPNIEEALNWARRMLTLLNTHHIKTCLEGKQLICFLAHEQVGGNAMVIVAKSEAKH